MEVLIAKLGATGDVVRTTSLLHVLTGRVTWITSSKNRCLLENLPFDLRPIAWEDRATVQDTKYDLVINLEDTDDVGQFVADLHCKQRFGACLDSAGKLTYTEDSHAWFDLSLISRFGRVQADQLKLENRRTYQDLVFSGLGFKFAGQPYVLPAVPDSDLNGDVAIAAEAGPVWPMKQWAFYPELKNALEKAGVKVNVLPKRDTILEHLADVESHRCVVGGDSLPMHFALGKNVRAVSIFNCTSPWEIHDYQLLIKLVSPLLTEFFYKRTFDHRATTAISLPEVLDATQTQLGADRPIQRTGAPAPAATGAQIL